MLPTKLCPRLLLVLTLICCTEFVRAHDSPPPSPPAHPVLPAKEMRTEVVHPPRWSWLHWWEANREEFLQPQPGSLGEQVVQVPEQPRDLRAKAVEALLPALTSSAKQARMEAALALGRMGEGSAVDKLKQLVARDPDAAVRQAAQAALALIGGQQAERALLDSAGKSNAQATAALSALAATTQPEEGTARSLEQIAKGKDPQKAVAAARALRSGKAARAEVFRDILKTTQNPWLAIEAILGLGETADPADIPLLSDILRATDGAAGAVQSWRGIQTKRAMRMQIAGGSVSLNRRDPNGFEERAKRFPADMQEYEKKRAGYENRDSKLYPPGTAPPVLPELAEPKLDSQHPGMMIVPVGMEEILLAHFRAAAAVALGRMNDPRARRVLAEALRQNGREWGDLSQDPNALTRMNEFSDLHKGMAIMSLGRDGDAASVPVLIDMLEGRIPNLADYSPERLKDSPLRGYAALALGVYARPAKKGGNIVDRPSFDTACEALARRLADPRETSEVRSGSALGLGVSNRIENLRVLQKIDISKEKDMALAGYTLLARAMLKDAEVTKLAEELLKRKVTNTVSDTVGRRAAVLALGVLGTQDVVLTLKWAWDQPYDVNREVARALGLSKAFDVTNELIDTLKEEQLSRKQKKPWLEAFAAKCLGELFMKNGRDQLSQLIRDSAYSLQNDASRPLQCMANEFLGRIIPGFEPASK